jgi:hypothetical protein
MGAEIGPHRALCRDSCTSTRRAESVHDQRRKGEASCMITAVEGVWPAYSTVKVLVSTWIGSPFSAEDSKARIS